MSYVKMAVVELFCDEPGCGRSDSTAGGCQTLRDERYEMAQRGWTFRQGSDFCPSHRKGKS